MTCHRKAPAVRLASSYPAAAFVIVTVGTLIIGLLVIAGSIFTDFNVSLTIAHAPVWLTLFIGVQTSFGAVHALWGAVTGYGSKAWHAQQVGIWFMMGGYSSYAVASFLAYPQALVHTVLALILAALCVWRFIELYDLERAVLADVRQP